MELEFKPKALRDIELWKKSGQLQIQKKITELLRDIVAHPYEGFGKPEALRYELSGKWSRRISKEDRLIYTVDEINQVINILSLKGHYED